ncbi:MAG: phenylalanine--tRNA ligase subunit beta [Melioribacteraceae bacterium]|nr:phenylalanine--tRNA ligase subunit beta [Melioribacteraceae bacterium]
MKISLNWLKDYIDLTGISIEEIIEKITYAGLEVEDVIDQNKIYQNIIVGFVKESKKHPNANKLSLCLVTDGKNDFNVVCGAPNVAAGQKVPFAKVGAIIPNGKFKIEKAKIRGEVSEGMICSEKELGISDNHDGIMVLEESLQEGISFSDAMSLNDIIMEINITPNRSDALSHIGVARDLSAIFNRPLKFPEIKINETKVKSEELAKVEIIDNVNCPRYVGKVVTNVTIKESPDWLKRKLKNVGLRPINNVVDVTNYILYEIGQPLHAFDLDKLAQKKIVVRNANENEKFVTLDSKERILKSTDLMICDAERPVAIAGVMGGENSEVTFETKNILIESAYFNPSSIRKTAKRLALSTDASYRFERGTDYNITVWAAKRAAQLIQETAGGEVANGEIDAYPKIIQEKNTFVRFSRIKKILGYEIENKEVENILLNLGFEIINKNEDKLELKIPSYRNDIEREIDIIEEVARIYGYNKIPEINKISITLEEKVDNSDFTDKTRNVFNALGFYEIITNSMLSENIAKEFGNPIAVLNPQSSEMSHIRPSLIPGILQTISNNLKVNEKDLMLFEIGKIFNQKNYQINSFEDFEENEYLIAAVTGKVSRDVWYEKERDFDFYDLKGLTSVSLNKLIPNISFRIEKNENIKNYYEYSVKLKIDKDEIGLLSKLSNKILNQFDINQEVFVLELNLDKIKNIEIPQKGFVELLKFPKIYRDFAFILDEKIESETVIKLIKESGSKLLHNVNLFDIFQSESLGKGKKSLAFQLEYFDYNRTLTEEEVEKDFRFLINLIETKLNAQLRGA